MSLGNKRHFRLTAAGFSVKEERMNELHLCVLVQNYIVFIFSIVLE